MLSKKNQGLPMLVALFVVLGAGLFVTLHQAQAAPFRRIVIEKNKSITKDRVVTLRFDAPNSTTRMKIGHDEDLDDAVWEDFEEYKRWVLEPGEGEKEVFVKFLLESGEKTAIYSDTINLRPPEIYVEMEFVEESPVDTRNVTVSTTVSEGVEAYRYGEVLDLSDQAFLPLTKNFPVTLSQGSGDKTVYIEFLNADETTKKYFLETTYQPPARAIEETSLVKGTGPAIYYYGKDAKLHPFIGPRVYATWYTNFDDIIHMSDVKLRQFEVGEPVCFRQGTWLVKFKGFPTVYAVEPACQLRPLRSPVEAYIYYGSAWGSRIVEFPAVYKSLYDISRWSIHDEDNDIIDRDGDGLDAAEEEENNASDSSKDTDGDGLSDFEEIRYWFSDPGNPDSDGDGYTDSTEVMSGYSPVGPDQFDQIPAGTYVYPRGSLVWLRSRGRTTYYYFDGKGHKIGTEGSKNFTTNNFQSQFVARSPFYIDLLYNGATVRADQSYYQLPHVLRNGQESAL